MNRPSWLASRGLLQSALPKEFEPTQRIDARVVSGVTVTEAVDVTYHVDGRVTFRQGRTVSPWFTVDGVSARYWVGSKAKRAVTVIGERWSITWSDGEQVLEGVGGMGTADEMLMRGIGLLDLPDCAVDPSRLPEVLRLVCDPEDVLELGRGSLADGVVTFRRAPGWVPKHRRPKGEVAGG